MAGSHSRVSHNTGPAAGSCPRAPPLCGSWASPETSPRLSSSIPPPTPPTRPTPLGWRSANKWLEFQRLAHQANKQSNNNQQAASSKPQRRALRRAHFHWRRPGWFLEWFPCRPLGARCWRINVSFGLIWRRRLVKGNSPSQQQNMC